RIEESTDSMHIKVGNESIPVADRTPGPSPGVLVETRKTECVRYHCGAGHVCTCNYAMGNLLGVKGFTVEKKFGIKPPRSPTVQYLNHCRYADTQQVRVRLQIRRQCGNSPDIEVVISPAIQPASNARR